MSDSVLIAVMAAIVLIALIRLRVTFRKARKPDRTEQIQKRLEELRKKRDEE